MAVPLLPADVAAVVKDEPWRSVALHADHIGTRAVNRLTREGFATLGDLLGVTEEQFLRFRSVGNGALQALRDGLRVFVTGRPPIEIVAGILAGDIGDQTPATAATEPRRASRPYASHG